MNKEILNMLYDKTKDLPVTDEYIRYKDEFVKERDNLIKEIGEQYRRKLEELNDITNNMNNELCKQSFYEAYSIAVKLFVEATYKQSEDI